MAEKINESIALQDYLKAIYKLAEKSDVAVSTSAIAERLQIAQASVTGMVKKLAEQGYIEHKPYKGVNLTTQGHQIAIQTIRRHRIIELFLVEQLEMSWDEVHDEAEVLEHSVSDKVVNRMWEVLGCPDEDPHGSPIPNLKGEFKPQRRFTLADAPVGQLLEIARIKDKSPEELRYLEGLGLVLNAHLTIEDRAPFQGPLLIKTPERMFALDNAFAQAIWVV